MASTHYKQLHVQTKVSPQGKALLAVYEAWLIIGSTSTTIWIITKVGGNRPHMAFSMIVSKENTIFDS